MKVRRVISDSEWTLAWREKADTGSPAWDAAVKGTVPGSIIRDLESAGMGPDPYFGENFRSWAWAGEQPFWYKTHFATGDIEPGTDVQAGVEWRIVFDGLDTFCEIFLNGVSLGSVHNMFMRHRFDVTDIIRPDTENELVVRIDPVLESTRKWREANTLDLSKLAVGFDFPERVAARKMQMVYGWDNCPHMLAGGIFRRVFLEMESGACIEETGWTVKGLNLEGNTASLEFWGTCSRAPAGCLLRIECRCHDHRFGAETRVENGAWQVNLDVKDALFWWPNGMGEQNVYSVDLSLLAPDGSVLDEESMEFGIRTVEVHTRPVETATVDFEIPEHRVKGVDGGMLAGWERVTLEEPREVRLTPFRFFVNGKFVFIKGADWQTPDVLPGSHDPRRTHSLLSAAKEAGMNMIRTWGGGCVEPDEFYRACTRQGLLVWQDFFFACAQYPREAPFLDEITVEIRDIIARLRNHTCIACWCGDNESDMVDHMTRRDPLLNPINKKIIPEALAELDIQRRYYHPSSPSGGPYPRSEWGGDRRDWGSWFPDDNYRHIRHDEGRFISEAGSYALPSLDTIKTFVPEDMLWPPDSQLWLLHSGDLDFAKRGFDERNRHCLAFFGNPCCIDEAVKMSQFAQAWGYKMLIEHHRRRRNECGGLLLWKLNDIWPAVDAGLFDYNLIPRTSYRFVVQANKPIAVSLVVPDGPAGDTLEIWTVNDTKSTCEAELETETLMYAGDDAGFKVTGSERTGLRIGGESATRVREMHVDPSDGDMAVWRARLLSDNRKLHETVYTVSPSLAWRYYLDNSAR